jgi:NAD(P)-dependent dehydrogenase (short-subunit alcohol dehydrogenase family)
MDDVVLVTGGSRGIGFEVARELAHRGATVIVTGTTEHSASAASKKIPRSRAHALDISDRNSVAALASWIRAEFDRLDVLVNNAAVLEDEGTSILETDPVVFEATMRTNALGPLLVTQAMASLLRSSANPRVVNVSSGAGQISSMTSYAPAYSISKAALNAVTVMLAAALPHVRVNCVDPGWVRTDMGGSDAPRSVAEGADTIVWLASLPVGGPTGGFYKDKKRIPW